MDLRRFCEWSNIKTDTFFFSGGLSHLLGKWVLISKTMEVQPNTVIFVICLERSISLLKGRWRKLGLLDHIDLELMVHLILASCVLHNYCLVKDNFDEGYFLDNNDDDDDDDDGSNGSDASNDSTPGGRDGLRAAEDKRVQLMNILA